MANVDGSLNFVTCEDPQLHTCLFDIINCLADLILQFVFDRCRAKQIKLHFKLFSDCIYCFLLFNRCGCLIILL